MSRSGLNIELSDDVKVDVLIPLLVDVPLWDQQKNK